MPRFCAVSRAIPAVALMAISNSSLFAQDSRRSLDLTVNHTGLSIGDSRRVNGLRINIRDTRLERVNGINATVLVPAKRSHGDVYGVAVGLRRRAGVT